MEPDFCWFQSFFLQIINHFELELFFWWFKIVSSISSVYQQVILWSLLSLYVELCGSACLVLYMSTSWGHWTFKLMLNLNWWCPSNHACLLWLGCWNNLVNFYAAFFFSWFHSFWWSRWGHEIRGLLHDVRIRWSKSIVVFDC